jgi:hypothetical protein
VFKIFEILQKLIFQSDVLRRSKLATELIDIQRKEKVKKIRFDKFFEIRLLLKKT